MTIGHNTEASRDLKDRAAAIAGKLRLQAQAKRQAKLLGDEITALYKLAQSSGYDRAILKGRIAELMMDGDQLQLHFDDERETAGVIESYRHALGLLAEDGETVGETDRFMAEVDRRLADAGYVQDDNGVWMQKPARGVSATVADINEGRRSKTAKIRGQRVDLPEEVDA